MPIVIANERPGVVGLTGYATGRNKTRQRQQQYAMAMLMRQERRPIERRPARNPAIAGGAPVGGLAPMGGLAPVGGGAMGGALGGIEWPFGMPDALGGDLDAPLAAPPVARAPDKQKPRRLALPLEDRQKLIQGDAQREDNARRRRLGLQPRFPEAEPQQIPVRKEDQQNAWDLQEEARDRKWDQMKADADERRKIAAEERAADRALGADKLDFFQDQETAAAEEVAEIRDASGGAWTDEGHKLFGKLTAELDALDKDQEEGGEGRLEPAEYHRARARAYQSFLDKFNPAAHTIRWAERPGVRRTVDGEIWERSRDPNKPDVFVDFAPEPPMSDADIRAGKSNRFRYYGDTMYQKVRTAHGTEWQPMQTGRPAEDSNEERNKRIRERAMDIWANADNYPDVTSPADAVRKAKELEDALDEALSPPSNRPGMAPPNDSPSRIGVPPPPGMSPAEAADIADQALNPLGNPAAPPTPLEMLNPDAMGIMSPEEAGEAEGLLGQDVGMEGVGNALAPSEPPAPTGKAPVWITSDEEYDALPSGTPFIGPDGIARRKP